MKSRRGFTLLELLIVVMILGILVAIALPLYTKAMEKGRMAEAVANLGALRSAEIRYYIQYNKTTGTVSQLDWTDPANAPASMGVKRFGNYGILNWRMPTDLPKVLSYTCVRNTIDSGTAYTVTMNNNGVVSQVNP